MKLQYFGHSAFLIDNGSYRMIIDPFLTNNGKCEMDPKNLGSLDYIFVTHGHGDHIGDTVELAKLYGATIICNFEIGNYFESYYGLDVHTMHIGGEFEFDFGKVKMIQALHGSGILHGGKMVCGGNPCGFLIRLDGRSIYHAGDTGLFGDMAMLSSYSIDYALLPIGDNYTMGVEDAIIASNLIKAKKVIPMHYGTFPIISANPENFREKCGQDVLILDFNENIEI